MSAQTTYTFDTKAAVAGGIYDLSPVTIDTFLNAENDGVMAFGLPVFAGTVAGTVKKFASGDTTAKFRGVTVNRRTNEIKYHGTDSEILKGSALGVMRHGRVYAHVADSITIAAGEAAYVGADGKFTNVSSGGVATNGKFVTAVVAGANGGRLAVVEL